MYIKSIDLQNFRNYEDLKIDFDEKLNIFTGKNAQGKTNILEAVFLNGLAKSFRTNKDSEMIEFGKDYSRVSSVICDDDKETEIEIIFKNEGKVIKVDGVRLQRSVDLLENFYVVVFSPDDLRIIKDGPESRRKFIDRELCQIKPLYYSDLGNYKKILKQRNFILKEKNNLDKNLLNVFDESLSKYGVRIIKERYSFTDRISEISKEIHNDISGCSENLIIKYETDFERDCTEEDFFKKLQYYLEKDILRGFTSIGPHKDDLAISFNETDIRSFGSQGQQRTAALSLKLAEIKLIKQETGKDAVLLLDDVLSELDLKRQEYLIKSMNNIQIFITATGIDSDLKALLPKGKAFNVDKANLEIYNY